MMVYALSSSIPSNMMERVFNVFINPWILGGILLHFLALAIWLWALSKVNITFAYPFIALGYVLVSLMAWRWLGEDLSLVKILGMGVIIVGILIVSSEM
jgi:drug/metabolite transporter (DMT)-like permease